MPILAASWMIGQGVSSRSSHSAAAGRITSAAKPCSQSRTASWSGPGSREKVLMVPPVNGFAHGVVSGAAARVGVGVRGRAVVRPGSWARRRQGAVRAHATGVLPGVT